MKGWAFVNESTKAHYFDESKVSLCGRWMLLSDWPLEDDKHESPQNCVACMKVREKNAAKGKDGQAED